MPTLDESLYQVHNYHETDCSPITENRFMQGNLYCWRGTVFTSPQCIAAEVCSPISFTEARNRFCLTFGGSKDPRHPGDTTCVPDKFVPNLPGMDPTVQNVRGGTVTYEDRSKCQGINGWFQCLGEGLKQSSQTPNLMKNAMIAVGGLFVLALVLRYTGVGSKLRKKNIFGLKKMM